MVLANLSTVWQLIYLQGVSQFIFRVSVNLSAVWQLIYLQGVSQFIFRVSVNLSTVWQLIYLQGVSQFIYRISANLSTGYQPISLQKNVCVHCITAGVLFVQWIMFCLYFLQQKIIEKILSFI